MIDKRYHIKIVPHRGESVHRFDLHRYQIVGAVSAVVLLLLGSMGLATISTLRSYARVASLRAQTQRVRSTVQKIDGQTVRLRAELRRVQQENVRIEQLIGVHVPLAIPKTHPRRTAAPPKRVSMRTVQATLRTLATASAATTSQTLALQQLAMKVLNITHLSELAEARLVADIPSIDPVPGSIITGCFCYRTYPDVEFHEGLDLAADYGTPVRAAAAGTVVAAGWDGGYGRKIVIDHGNGYQTWYAHLSRLAVHPGERVYKGEEIAYVGESGFATGPHLHYQVMLDGVPINPAPYLHGIPSNVVASLP